MDLYTVAIILLLYGVAKGDKQALRTGGGDIIIDPDQENPEQKPSKVMAVLIVEDAEESKETNTPMKVVMLPVIKNPEIMMPWIEHAKQKLPLKAVVKPRDYDVDDYDDDEDTSGESNSDEYSDTDTELDSDQSATDSESDTDSYTDTDSESSYYQEDDYMKDKIMKKIAKLNAEKTNSKVLRNRWKSCQKKASKYCRQACIVSYKNGCEEQKCKKKLKKVLKKECKRNCKEFFVDS